jgi:hypothetical protein
MSQPLGACERAISACDIGAIGRRCPCSQASHRTGPDDEQPTAVEFAYFIGHEPVGSANK